jgi:putative ABC transport system ATP-binding protein
MKATKGCLNSSSSDLPEGPEAPPGAASGARDLPAVHCSGLQRHFHRAGGTVRAVDGIDLTVPDGSFFGVVGTSGSGKTTLLNLIGGLDTPTGGHISVFGRPLETMDEIERARHRRRTVGIIFQASHMIPSRTALENVELPLLIDGSPPDERRERARLALERVGLEERGDHRPDELSGGEQQRVAIARALVKQPRLLLADEPTGNLDSRTGGGILELIAALNRGEGLTVVLVSHDERAVATFADRSVRLFDGRIVEGE